VTAAHKPFIVFAYRLLSRVFVKGHVKAYDIPELPLDPIPSNFASLGFDAVSKSIADFFECSPLSCNYMAAQIAGVNRYCLMNTLYSGRSRHSGEAVLHRRAGAGAVLRDRGAAGEWLIISTLALAPLNDPSYFAPRSMLAGRWMIRA
jgi:hypothetical protein